LLSSLLFSPGQLKIGTRQQFSIPLTLASYANNLLSTRIHRSFVRYLAYTDVLHRLSLALYSHLITGYFGGSAMPELD